MKNNYEKVKLQSVIIKIIDNRGKTPPWTSKGPIELIETASIVGVGKYPDYSLVQKFISEEIYKTWFRSHPQKKDILIATVGENIGNLSIMSENRGTVAQNLVGLRVNESVLNPDFLYYFLTQREIKALLKNLDIGAAQPSIKVPHLLNLEIPVPPLSEQRAIADVLSALDDKIELNHRMNQTLDALTQAIFGQFFINSGKEKVENIFLSDLIKETIAGDWGSDAFDDICSDKVFCVRGADINNINLGSLLKIPIRYLKKTSIEKRKILSGDIVIELSGGSPSQSTGRSSVIFDFVINSIPYPIVCSNFCRVIRLQDVKHSIFVSQLLNYYYSKDEFFQYENGTTGIKNFAFNAFAAQCEIPKCFEVKIDEFNSLVDPLYIKKYSNTLESNTLTELRDILLPKLMSGQVRVHNNE